MSIESRIIDYLIAAFADVTEIHSVQRKYGMMKDVRQAECPAIRIAPGADRSDHEAFGGGSNNTQTRKLALDLHVRVIESARPPQVETDGSLVKDAVLKCILSNRTDDSGVFPQDISVDAIEPDEFEFVENGISQFRVSITVTYQFVLSDL